ncbi:hypothetical protein QEN19_001825 [Hanseniaspora menglaensis]
MSNKTNNDNDAFLETVSDLNGADNINVMIGDNITNSSEKIMDEILNILEIKLDSEQFNNSKKKNTRQKKHQANVKKYTNVFSGNESFKENIPNKYLRNNLQFKLHKLADHFTKLVKKDDQKIEELSKIDGFNKKRKRNEIEDKDEPEDKLKKFKKSADEALKLFDYDKSIPAEKLENHKKRMEEDPLYNNPKSEYVQAQSLPKVVKIMGLFNEDESEKTEKFPNATKKLNYLRAKYGVKRFPKRDLIADLPGKMPDLDLTHPKPANQIQFSTFLSYIEPFFRKFVDKDDEFLMQDYVVPNRILASRTIGHNNIKDNHSYENILALESTFDELNENKIYDPNLTPYMIPKLGQFYYLKWYEENPNVISFLNNTSSLSNQDNENGANFELKQLLSKFPGQYNHIPQIVLPKGDSSVFLATNPLKTSNGVNNSKQKGKGTSKKNGFQNKDDENTDNGLDMDNAVSLGPLSSRLLQCIMTDEILTEENENTKTDNKFEDLGGIELSSDHFVSIEKMEEKIRNQLKEKKPKVKSEGTNGEIDFDEEEDEDEFDEDDEDDDEEDDFDEFGEDEDELIEDDEDGFDEIFEADANANNNNNSDIQEQGASNFVEKSTVPFSWKIENPKILSNLNYLSFEERIRQELKTLGVFGVANKSLGKAGSETDARDDINWVNEREDDEVCSELRKIQVKLREVSQRNNQRKQVLRPIVKKHLAYQDYEQILDNLNKQVDHEYARRLKNSHNKKKKKTVTEQFVVSSEDVTSAQQFQLQQQEIQHGIADVNLKKLLEKRKKWMDYIGVIFANDESDDENIDDLSEINYQTSEPDDKFSKKIKKYMVSENEFLMDGIEEIGAQSLDPAVNMKRAPRTSVFKNLK